MTERLSLAVSTSDDIYSELGRNLIHYNSQKFGPMEIRPLCVSLRDSAGKLRAGLAAKTFYNWLTIELLWVAEDLRGQGHGSVLILEAEKAAASAGCTDAWVDTIGNDALPFYAKHGYAAWGELPDYPKGQKRVFLRKKILA